MSKKLTRKFATLFVLCAALITFASAPASSIKRGVFCVDAPLDSGCYGWICCNEWGGCWCA